MHCFVSKIESDNEVYYFQVNKIYYRCLKRLSSFNRTIKADGLQKGLFVVLLLSKITIIQIKKDHILANKIYQYHEILKIKKKIIKQ